MAARQVTLHGNPLTLTGSEVKVGQLAPDFTAVANDLTEFKLSSVLGRKAIVLSAVPSLDTPVCDIETRRFNQEAASLGDDVQIVTISMDLPFAQKRWCGAAGIDKVKVVSDHRDASFGKAYGVLIEGLRLLARVIFVVDKKGVLRYCQQVPEVSQEPKYDEVLAAVRNLTQ